MHRKLIVLLERYALTYVRASAMMRASVFSESYKDRIANLALAFFVGRRVDHLAV